MRFIFSILFFVISAAAFSQHLTDTLIAKTISSFESQGYKLEIVIKQGNIAPNVIPDIPLSCYSGKQVLLMAFFDKKPLELFGRMIVRKKLTSKTKFVEYKFQDAEYDKYLKIHYALLSVYFSEEATFKNCSSVVQVYDKQQPANKIWLAVLTK